MNTTLETQTQSVDRQSSALQGAPQLTHRSLTVMLTIMCLVPAITIGILFSILPKVYEGQLEASVSAKGLPSGSYYETEYYEREAVPTGQILIRNDSDQDWTHLNIQINGHYQIYDVAPIEAFQTREFNLDRFITRTGAKFNLRYNPLKSVRIYARRPSKDRATFFYDFEKDGFEELGSLPTKPEKSE